MLKNKNISNLIIEEFKLSLESSQSDKIYKNYLGNESWSELKDLLMKERNCICQGCGFKPFDKNFLEMHIVSGDVQNLDSYKIVLLCKTCHTLQHIDVAANMGWIKLCNSIHDQKKIIHICRSGGSNLMEKINSGEIMLLNEDSKVYSEKIKIDIFHKRKKMKAVFGKKFPENRLK